MSRKVFLRCLFASSGGFEILSYVVYKISVEYFSISNSLRDYFSKHEIIIFVDRLSNFNIIKMVSFFNNIPKFAHLFF